MEYVINYWFSLSGEYFVHCYCFLINNLLKLEEFSLATLGGSGNL